MMTREEREKINRDAYRKELTERYEARRTILRLEAKKESLERASISCAAHLAAAISLLERGSKKAAPSDKMFDQMLDDYRSSLEELRKELKDG